MVIFSVQRGLPVGHPQGRDGDVPVVPAVLPLDGRGAAGGGPNVGSVGHSTSLSQKS